MSLDQFLDREFKHSYTCGHFVAEVWKHLTGEDISDLLIYPVEKAVMYKNELPMPLSPCLVTFINNSEPHVGIYFEGKLIHLVRNLGVRYESLSKYKCKMEFYR